MFKKTKFFAFSLFLLFFFVVQGCKSTKVLDAYPVTPEAPYNIAEEISFESSDEGNEDKSKYLFIRLYNPEYSNPFYIANILKGGLQITKNNQGPDLSHASINFDLEDNFFGLTFGGKYQLAEEACQFPLDNKYMRNCNPSKSEQVTYALKVTEEEYENTKKFIEIYASNTKLKYASLLNVKIGLFSIKRKFFSKKDQRVFGTVKYPKNAKNKKVDLENDKLETRFVCSTFIGFVLYNTVESVTEFFDEHNIKYDYMDVSDISLIPGMTRLFSSTWDNYVKAAYAFVEEYPEFKEYLNDY